MKRQASHNGLSSLERFVTSGRGMQHSSSATTDHGDATRRQKKHDMLVTFMANAHTPKRRPAPVRPKLLTTLLSIFF
ncbi:MAG: hypothetical protein JWQ38_3262 [Flavipsychrobacter sp.]|nr:hypothetical protein [Flavipsychrobacter sp.]